MDIEAVMIKEELGIEESKVIIKTEKSEYEDIISPSDIKTEKELYIKNEINKIFGTSIKEEFNDHYRCETNIKEEKVSQEVKEALSSDNEDGEEESLPKIKPEEVILKCEREGDDSETGKQEIQAVDRNKKNVCDRCNYRTRYGHHLRRHMFVHEKGAPKQHGCHLCDYRTHRNGDLQRHIITHGENSVKKYGCHLCVYRCKNNRTLMVHMSSKHDVKSIEPHSCNLCGYNTYEKSNLTRHMIIKHDEHCIKKHSCEVCGFKTHYRNHLKRHVISRHKI